MKKSLFTIFMFLCIVSFCHENNCNEEREIAIVRSGETSGKNARSGDPIEATYNSSCLTIRFNVGIGQTDISIENEYGNTAYSSTINVIEHEVLFVPIGNLPSGTYYITMIYNGGCAEGEFRIER